MASSGLACDSGKVGRWTAENAGLLSAPSGAPTLWAVFCSEIARWGKNKIQSKEFLQCSLFQLAVGVGAAVVLGEESSPLNYDWCSSKSTTEIWALVLLVYNTFHADRVSPIFTAGTEFGDGTAWSEIWKNSAKPAALSGMSVFVVPAQVRGAGTELLKTEPQLNSTELLT